MTATTVFDHLAQFKNLLLVLGAVCVGVLLPEFGLYTEPLVTPLVIFLIFGSLRGLRLTDVNPASYAGTLVLSLVISYTVLPLGGMWVASRFLSDGALTGVAIVLAVPTTAGSAIIWTRLSDGDDQLSILISVVSLLLAPLVTPVVFRMLMRSHVETPVGAMLWDLVIIVGSGVALTLLVPTNLVSEKAVDRGAGFAILLLIYSSVATLDLGSVALGDFAPLVLVTLLVLGGGFALSVLVGYGMRLRRSTVLPLFFTSTLKNLGIALFISFSYPSPLTVAAIVTYYVVQQLFGAVIADFVPLRSLAES